MRDRKTTKSTTASARNRAASSERRGNVLVLVAGILVLLVITATAYLSRTRAERRISIAQRDAGQNIDIGRSVRDMLSQEIAEALFPRPIDIAAHGGGWDPTMGNTEDPNIPRLAIIPFAPRYGADLDYGGTGRPQLWWNFAPHETRAWTNWPDGLFDRLTGMAPRSDDIPGNPGTADARWLSDLEPQRWYATQGGGQFDGGDDGSLTTPDRAEYFSHWLHMVNPMRPGNGWIVVPFIDDVVGSITGYQQGTTNDPADFGPYGTPFEQWQPHTLAGADAADPALVGHGAYLPADFRGTFTKNFVPTNLLLFRNRWIAWFTNYSSAYRDLISPQPDIPGNLYHLRDLGFDLDNDGTNQPLEFGERPQDAYMGPGDDLTGTFPDGAPRWHVERTLVDADGDGVTDSFWYQAPTSIDEDHRTLVAMRVVDLSGMINVNTATQFVRGRPETGPPVLLNHGTRGHGPADVALGEVIQPGLIGLDLSYSGFLLHPEHSETSVLYTGNPNMFPNGRTVVEGFFPDGSAFNSGTGAWDDTVNGIAFWTGFDPAMWQGSSSPPTMMLELGLDNDFLKSPLARLDYFRRAGRYPYDPRTPDMNSSFAPQTTYRPFTLADELELRAYGSLNSPWTFSRLERALQFPDQGDAPGFVHAFSAREETQTYLDALDVKPTANWAFDEILHDRRRMMTTISGARNETMPQWLWWEHKWSSPNAMFSNALPSANFLPAERLKLDLREIFDNRLPPQVMTDAENGIFRFRQLLPWRILTALSDNPALGSAAVPPGVARYYYLDNSAGGNALLVDDLETPLTGREQREYEQTARLAAGLAANMGTYRDGDLGIGFFTGAPGYVPYGFLEDEAVAIPLVPGSAIDAPGTVHSTRRMLGMEVQPFIVEAFIAHVAESVTAQFNHPNGITAGMPGIVDGDDPNVRHSVIAVQIANPYDKPIPLVDADGNNIYVLSFFEQDYPLFDATLPMPRVEILPGQAVTYYAIGDDEQSYRFALDLQFPAELDPDSPGDAVDANQFSIENVNAAGIVWSTDPNDYDGGNAARAVEIKRTMINDDQLTAGITETVNVLIDRIDIQGDGMFAVDDTDFGEMVQEDMGFELNSIQDGMIGEPPDGQPWNNVVILTNGDRWWTYARVTREWDRDISMDGVISEEERNPRYVFSLRESRLEMGGQTGFISDSNVNPADNWFNEVVGMMGNNDTDDSTRPTRFHPFDEVTPPYLLDSNRPRFKDTTPIDPMDFSIGGITDLIDTNFAMQMLQKDADFEQVGEIRNVWTYGHMLRFLPVSPQGLLLNTSMDDGGTIRTFAEFMVDGALSGMDARVNRLRTVPYIFDFDGEEFAHSNIVGIHNAANLTDQRALQPDLPAGVRLFDAFVCDSAGVNAGFADVNGNGTPGDLEDFALLTFENAALKEFRLTPGLININTAPREVMHGLPHMSQLVHETNFDDFGNPMAHLSVLDPMSGSLTNPAYEYNAGRIRVAQSIETYRNQQGLVDMPDLNSNIADFRPAYGARGFKQGGTMPWDPSLDFSRGDRGFVSIGELSLLNRNGRTFATNPPPNTPAEQAQWAQGFSIEAVAQNHLRSAAVAMPGQVDNDLSIDVIDRVDPLNFANILPDEVSADAEESHMLFAGLSNLVTTRSDVFGVWFKVRIVRQDPSTGIWDGTDPDSIVEESRYFMIVDRSRVNSVSDAPEILLFEKLPN